MATFLKLAIVVLAMFVVHLTVADHSHSDVGQSPISTDAAESRSDVKIPAELSHLKPGESLYFYYEPIQNKQNQAYQPQYGHQHRRQEGSPQAPRNPPPQPHQRIPQQPQRKHYNPYQQRVGRPVGLMGRIRNMFSFNPFWRNQISRQLEVVAASPLLAGAVVAGITALAGGLVYTQGILSEPAPVVTPAPSINDFRPAITTRNVNRIVSAIQSQASVNPNPDQHSSRPLSDDEVTTTTPTPDIADDASDQPEAEDSNPTQNRVQSLSDAGITTTTPAPSEDDTTIGDTTVNVPSSTDLVDAILDVALGTDDNVVGDGLLGVGESPTLDSASDDVVRLGDGEADSQNEDDDTTESMLETTTGLPDTTAKVLKLTMQKASSLYPDMILLPLTQGDTNDPAATTTMVPETGDQDEANERVGLPTTTTPKPIEDSESDLTTIKSPERVKFGSSDQVIDFIKQLTSNIIDDDPSKPNVNGEERSQPDSLPSANSSENDPTQGESVTEALEASNIFDRISLNAEAKEELEAVEKEDEAASDPTTIANLQGKDDDKS